MSDIEPSAEALEQALTEWSDDRSSLNDRRDRLVRSAHAAGITKHRIHVLSGIARTTIDDILGDPAYTDRLFTKPQEHTLYPRPEHRYDCSYCAASGYHYPATGEVFAYHTCVRRSGHVWVYEDTMQTEGTGDLVFAPETTTEQQP